MRRLLGFDLPDRHFSFGVIGDRDLRNVNMFACSLTKIGIV